MSGDRTTTALLFLERGTRLLDVGFGSGHILEQVRDRFAELHGIDIAPCTFDAARGKGWLLARAQLDDGALPYRPGMFDAAVCLDVLEHVREPGRLLAAVHAVLRPGGQLIASTPNIRQLRRVWSILVRGTFPTTSDDPSAYDGGHIHYFTPGDLTALVRGAGFVEVTLEPILDRDKLRMARTLAGPVADWFCREFWSGGILVVARRP